MSEEDFIKQSYEFDREIKEAERAAFYALTAEEKLDYINQAKKLKELKKEFRQKYKKVFDVSNFIR